MQAVAWRRHRDARQHHGQACNARSTQVGDLEEPAAISAPVGVVVRMLVIPCSSPLATGICSMCLTEETFDLLPAHKRRRNHETGDLLAAEKANFYNNVCCRLVVVRASVRSHFRCHMWRAAFSTHGSRCWYEKQQVKNAAKLECHQPWYRKPKYEWRLRGRRRAQR